MAIDINRARKILGTSGKNFSDENLSQVLINFYELAEVIAYTITSRGSNYIFKGLENNQKEDHHEK